MSKPRSGRSDRRRPRASAGAATLLAIAAWTIASAAPVSRDAPEMRDGPGEAAPEPPAAAQPASPPAPSPWTSAWPSLTGMATALAAAIAWLFWPRRG